MQTGKFVISEDRILLRRFTYWSADLIGPDMHVTIRPIREIGGHADLTSQERAELYAVALPETERVMARALCTLGENDVAFAQLWTGKELLIKTPYLKPEIRASQIRTAYQRALTTAA